MQTDIEKVITTPNEELRPCPMCGGRVYMLESSWEWGPYDLRHVKYRCSDCGGIFEYAWRTDPHKHVPNAVEWFNTRTAEPLKTCAGYNVEQLLVIAELLKENEITPTRLDQLCDNLGKAVQIAERKFTRDLHRQLQERLAQMPGRKEEKTPTPWSYDMDDDRETCGLLEED